MQNAERRQLELDREVQLRVNTAMAAERKKFKNSEHRYRYWLYITIGYGFIVTLFAGIYIPGFLEACSECGRMITDELLPNMVMALELPARAAHVADLIPHIVWADIVYWAVLLTICGASIWGIRWCIAKIRQFVQFYKRHIADLRSLEVMLVSVATAVFFAEPIQTIGINAIAAMLLINIGYTVLRCLNIWKNSDL